ncbi:hypothetical protein AAW01_01565 [Aurantiacibacter gangjinensis]|uniref:TadE-like domain-containing protein n=2 Tax=Aurantiacibacter gangjinensis TaxID=502682 RepID=A0A0G9MSQ3_9SPHN|nr:hypothetical protein AAW01_01565 [Aurantiacibacter gangjinensis]
MRRALLSIRRLRRKDDGVAAVEFAILAPVLIVMLVGLMDFGLQVYTRSLLHGAMQTASRDSALEPGGPTAAQMDANVTSQVHNIMPSATITFTRSNYENYSDVAQPEIYTDSDGDGECNNGEPFEDMNGNGFWDADMGRSGRGGASDAVLYQADVSYTRLLPIHRLITSIPAEVSVRSATVLRNQPYDSQARREPTQGFCT